MEVVTAIGLFQPTCSMAWKTLSTLFSIYGNVKNKRSQLGALLERCNKLLKELEALSTRETSNALQIEHNLDFVMRAIEKTGEVLKMIQQKGFVWCLMHPSDIDRRIESAKVAIVDAYQHFNIAAHLDSSEFQAKMEVARKEDHSELVARLEDISKTDQKILDALEDRDGQRRRMEELYVALLKYVEGLGEQRNTVAPEERFLRNATATLERVSKSKHQQSPHVRPWTLTSLEVTIYRKEVIGRGAFGMLYRGEWAGKTVAVKQMHQEDSRTLDEKDKKAFLKEVEIWSLLNHHNVLRFFGACLESVQPFMVSEYCKYGNVCEYLRGPFPEADRLSLLSGIVSGMIYLHGNSIVHGDLKGVNVLVDDNHQAILADFGISRLLDDTLTARSRASLTASLHGTLRWMAPECLHGARAKKASDVYSFAITAWEVCSLRRTYFDVVVLTSLYIFSGEVPFFGIYEPLLAKRVVDEGERPKRPVRLDKEESDPLWKLMESCWDGDPSARPSFVSIQDIMKYDLPKPKGSPEPEPSTPYAPSKISILKAQILELIQSARYEEAATLLDELNQNSQTTSGPEYLERLQIMHMLAVVHGHLHRYTEAMELIQSVVETRSRILGANHRETLDSRHYLAITFLQLGRFSAAAAELEVVVDVRKRVLGTGLPDTLDSIHALASAYHCLERHTDAAVLLQEAVDGRRSALTPGHPDTLRSMHLLALVQNALKGPLAAVQLLEQVVEERNKVCGTENVDTLDSVHRLAVIYNALERRTQAVELLGRVSEARARALGANHPDTLESTHQLAIVNMELMRFDDAATVLERLVTARQEAFVLDDVDTVANMDLLAVAYTELGRNSEAAFLLEQVVEHKQRILGAAHEETLRSTHALATAYSISGRYPEAIDLFEGLAETLTGDDALALDSSHGLAVAYMEQQRFKDAAKLLRAVVRGRTRVLGAYHPDTLESMDHLASALSYTPESSDETVSLFKTVWIGRKKVLGHDHVATMDTAHRLALSLYDDPGQRTKLLEGTLKLRKRVLGEDDINTLSTAHHLAADCSDLQQRCRILENVVRARERVLGKGHPDTHQSVYLLAATYNHLHRFGDASVLCERLSKARRAIRSVEDVDYWESRHTQAVEYWESRHLQAVVYYNLHRYSEAIEVAWEVWRERSKGLGSEDIDTLNSGHLLAMALYCIEENIRAYRLLETIAGKRADILGAEHVSTLASKHLLVATSYKLQKHLTKPPTLVLELRIETLIKEVVEARKETFGMDHVDTLESMHLLAAIYFDVKQFAEAETLLQPVVESRKVAVALNNNQESPNSKSMDLLVHSMRLLAEILRAQRKNPAAKKLEKEIETMEKKHQNNRPRSSSSSLFFRRRIKSKSDDQLHS